MTDKTSNLSFIGIGMGAFALLLALVHFYAGPFSTQPTLQQTVAEKAVAIRDATVAALKGEEVETSNTGPTMDLDKLASIATAVLGGLAIIFGVIGFAKHESIRAASGAAILGSGAIAFQFLTVALGAILFAIILFAVISPLGLG